jgi:predicted PurR-regulated permease PerM
VKDDDRSPKLSASNDELLLLAIRIVCLGFLGYWSLILIRPFLTMIVWSIIIAVALYPIFDWLSAKLYGHRIGSHCNYYSQPSRNAGSSDLARP